MYGSDRFAPSPINFSGFENLVKDKQQQQPQQQLGPDGLPIGPNNGQYDPNWTAQVQQQQPGFRDRAMQLLQLGKLFGFGM